MPIAKVKVVTQQKRLLTSFKLNMDQKILRLGKVTSAHFKIGKRPFTLATSTFQELFVIKFDSNSN